MSSPRIIAGKAKGARLKSVPGTSTRPITDRVKEALFNILATDIDGSVFFDTYGGTGSVGIEALSRGAAWVRFIDNKHPAIETIKTNLKNTHFEQDAEVLLSDTLTYIKRIPDRVFDYIYVAPPQYKDLWLDTLKAFDSNPGWLSPDGWIIVQIDPLEYQASSFQHFEEFEQRRYGSTLLVFYEVNQNNEEGNE